MSIKTQWESPAQNELGSRYAYRLAADRARRWDQARRAFRAALDAVPCGEPSATLLKRIDCLAAAPPTGDRDGVWRLDQK